MSSAPDSLLLASSTDPAFAQICDRIIESLQAGDSVDLAALTLEHPEYADQLRRLVPALEALVDLGASSVQNASRSGSTRIPSEFAPKVLGDYRILREIGRGGMGVVYEAEQRSLNRRVALKVLPMAAALDARQFQRFQLEAQAAACLHHNNIVPVFAVGTEGGVPYYAMQYIEGRSLAQVIGELRRAEGMDPAVPEPGDDPQDDPTTTALARSLIAGGPTLVCAGPLEAVTAIDALPSPPAASEPPTSSPRASTGSSTQTRAYARTIAGLGLQVAEALDHAHTRGILHRDIKPGNLILDAENRIWVADFGLAQIQGSPSLTLTGDILGTLRYMSPEQALGKRVVVDGRTDVYSLGVTLFELLTLRPAVGGKDRAEILARIASDDSPRLRRLNPAAPIDLETIVQKAIAKDPTARYATAKDLADDLRSFLDDRPIQARPPSLLDRATKWTRRHSAPVAAASVTLILAVIGLATSTVLISRERSEAIRQRNFARQAVDEMYTQFAEKWLSEQPYLDSDQRTYLLKALAYYERFAQENEEDPEIIDQAAKAYSRVGAIQKAFGKYSEAEKAYRESIRLRTKLADTHPEVFEYRDSLAVQLGAMGALSVDMGRLDEMERYYRHSLVVAEQLKKDFPSEDTRKVLGFAHSNLGAMMNELNRWSEAEFHSRNAVAFREGYASAHPDEPYYLFALTRSLSNLAGSLMEQKRFQEALDTIRRSVDIQDRLASQYPEGVRYRLPLAMGHYNLGMAQQKSRQNLEAIKSYERSLGLIKVLSEEFPNRLDVRKPVWLAECCSQLARLLAGGTDTNDIVLDRALATAKWALELEPKKIDYWITLSIVHQARHEEHLSEVALLKALEIDPNEIVLHHNLALMLLNLARKDPRTDSAIRAVRHAERAVELSPDRDRCWFVLAQCYHRISEWQKEIAAWNKACELSPNDDVYLNSLAWELATNPEAAVRDPGRAVELAKKATAMDPKNAGRWNTLGVAQYRAGDFPAAIHSLDTSIELDPSGGDSFSFFFLAMAHWHSSHQDEARLFLEKAVAWMDLNSPQDEELIRFREEAVALIALESSPNVPSPNPSSKPGTKPVDDPPKGVVP